jgi:hypothetical protein
LQRVIVDEQNLAQTIHADLDPSFPVELRTAKHSFIFAYCRAPESSLSPNPATLTVRRLTNDIRATLSCIVQPITELLTTTLTT